MQQCTVADANTSCADGTGSLTVAAGSQVSLNATEANVPAGANMHWTAVFTSTP